jgi:hypothetical protein
MEDELRRQLQQLPDAIMGLIEFGSPEFGAINAGKNEPRYVSQEIAPSSCMNLSPLTTQAK